MTVLKMKRNFYTAEVLSEDYGMNFTANGLKAYLL